MIAAQATSQQRTAAAQAVQMDSNLTCIQQLQVLSFFHKDIAAADTYLAIDETKLCTDFILGALV